MTKKISCPGGNVHVVTELYRGELYSVAAFCDKARADRYFKGEQAGAAGDDQTRFYRDTIPLQ